MRRIGRQHWIIDFTDSIFQLSNSAGQAIEVIVSFWVWYFPCRDIRTMTKKFLHIPVFFTIRLFLALFKLENDVDAADDDKWHCFTITHFSNQSVHTLMKKKIHLRSYIFNSVFMGTVLSVCFKRFFPVYFQFGRSRNKSKKWMSDLPVTPTVTQPCNPVTFEI